MKKISIISALALSALVYACKKDKDDKKEEPQKKPADLIVGTWGYGSRSEYVTSWSGSHDTTYRAYAAQDSLIFKADGSVISRRPSINNVDTSTYRFIADSTLIWEGDTLKVSLITENKLKLNFKDTIFGNSGGLRETVYEYKK